MFTVNWYLPNISRFYLRQIEFFGSEHLIEPATDFYIAFLALS